MRKNQLERWTCRDAADLYGIREWSEGYFSISANGEVVVRPGGVAGGCEASLMEVVAGLKERGLKPPVLLRFAGILESRITLMHETFARVVADAGYKGCYRGVYPLKVNQQQQVVEEIVRYGRRYHHGLEVGSKAELIAALAYLRDPDAFLVCNGYKDKDFVELALYALKMGLQPLLVIEMMRELPLILDCAERLGVRPRLGVRVKLSSRAGGHWTESGGDRSVFGLTPAEIMGVVDELRCRDRLDCLQLLHYHLGSQIPNIRSIRAAAYEACRYYVNLVAEGAPMGILDVGGGLAVDYDGSHTNFASSSNYGLTEYAADIVEVVKGVMDEKDVPHPVLVTESGRATVAHHSVLLFNILDVSRVESSDVPSELPADAHEAVRNLFEVLNTVTRKNVQEHYHDAAYYRDEIRSLFQHGAVSLRERALCEQLFWHVVARCARVLEGLKYVPDELQGLGAAIADVYYGNFSVFQSLPDAWAIEQLFPIMPIHRLDERPTRQATLADITCDCDGKIDRFIDLHDVKHVLPLHELDRRDYYLGVFLVGAYQETLGDLHNLLGDTHVVGVDLSADDGVHFVREINGDTVDDVLSYVEYEPKELRDRIRQTAEEAVRSGRLTPQERYRIMSAYESGLRGYTYFGE